MSTNDKNSMHSRCLFIKLTSTVLLMHEHDTKSENVTLHKILGILFKNKI